jgi:predicted Zn-dependent protease
MQAINRREAIHRLGLLGGAAAAAGLTGCATNPVTGKTEFMLMSERKEIAMGQEAHGQIQAQYGVYANDDIQQWFSGHGTDMAKISHRKKLPWTFTVLDSPVINAFAVPGGYVYVTRGILSYFNDEAQMAGVLGHELGHVTARHTAARYSKSQVASIGLALGSIFSEEFAQWADLASLGTQLLFLKFSRDNERQADTLGVEYSSEVGYDATHISDFFQTLERLRPEGGSLPAWQSTHPDPGDRVNATRSQALAYQKKNIDRTFIIERASYLERINGMVFGNDPRQGYEKDGVFVHPEMAFRFPVPTGWKVNNMPTEVRMNPEDGAAMLIFTLAPGTTPQEASSQFTQGNSVTVTESSDFAANGLTGLKTTGQMAGQEQTLDITSYYLTFDDKVFAFHGLAGEGTMTSYAGTFDPVARGFGRLDNSALADVSPRRIEVRGVERRTTLERAFNSFNVPEDKIDDLAILNGRELLDVLEPGERVKLVAGDTV